MTDKNIERVILFGYPYDYYDSLSDSQARANFIASMIPFIICFSIANEKVNAYDSIDLFSSLGPSTVIVVPERALEMIKIVSNLSLSPMRGGGPMDNDNLSSPPPPQVIGTMENVPLPPPPVGRPMENVSLPQPPVGGQMENVPLPKVVNKFGYPYSYGESLTESDAREIIKNQNKKPKPPLGPGWLIAPFVIVNAHRTGNHLGANINAVIYLCCLYIRLRK